MYPMRTSLFGNRFLRRRSFLAGGAALLLAATLHAQANGASALKPPPGARVAIVEFDDLECPACAHANPTLKSAVAKYKIPWIRHDFLIPGHIWSPTAAVNARWLDSKGLGDEYRDYIFQRQLNVSTSIYTLPQLNQVTQQFVQDHHIAWPMMGVDPQGKLMNEIQADKDLGLHLGINQTPTIYIAIANSKAAPYIEVKNVDQDLYQDIDQAFANAGPPPAVKTAHK